MTTDVDLDFFFPGYGYVGYVNSVSGQPTTLNLTESPLFDGAAPSYPVTPGTPLTITPTTGPVGTGSYLGGVMTSSGVKGTCTLYYDGTTCPTLTCGSIVMPGYGTNGGQGAKVCPLPANPLTASDGYSQFLQGVLQFYPGVQATLK